MSTVPESRTGRVWTPAVQALLGALASRAREAGANEVMKKPPSARYLATPLARVLRQPS
jgi:hypothetical protein